MSERRYGDGKIDSSRQKDIKNIFKVGGFKDRKTKRQKLLGANARTERQKL